MTAPAPVSAPTTPISGHCQVTVHRCLTICCAICGLDAWDEYVVHFDSEHELWEWVSDAGLDDPRGWQRALREALRRRRLRRARSPLG